MKRDIDHPMPLFDPHSREHGVIMDPGIVDEDMDGTGFEKRLQGVARLLEIGDVKLHRLRGSARRSDLFRNFLCRIAVCIRMHEDVASIGGEPPANRAADAPTPPRNECPLSHENSRACA